jgi:hypothetical protein
VCTEHEFCSNKGISKRRENGWSRIADQEELQSKYSPKPKYLAQRRDPSETLRRSVSVRIRGSSVATAHNL